ncbi:hypothetical protein ACFQ6U_14110 [Streptomyces sp. NPDC056465]|uniref:hypothetical protein n=1 Tax=unclassified Streptomyces TaxID=2593676 RepID=UPI0035DADBDF
MVTLAKTPQVLFFLAVVAHPGTENAKVHRLALTKEESYDALLQEVDLEARAIDGGEYHIVIAGDRSAAHTAALQGGTSEAMLDLWLNQQGV